MVRRPEHDEPPAFVPATAVAQDESARHESAHGMRHEIHRRARSKPTVDLRAQRIGRLREIKPPIVGKRLHVPLVRGEAELLHDARENSRVARCTAGGGPDHRLDLVDLAHDLRPDMVDAVGEAV